MSIVHVQFLHAKSLEDVVCVVNVNLVKIHLQQDLGPVLACLCSLVGLHLVLDSLPVFVHSETLHRVQALHLKCFSSARNPGGKPHVL